MKHKNISNSLRMLEILDFLKKESNFKNPKNTNDINKYLNNVCDSSVNRKSIYSDIKKLISFGHNINKFGNKGFYYSPELDLSEIKTIVDAVCECCFLSIDDRKKLIDKILNLVSFEEAKKIKEQQYILKTYESYKNCKYIISEIMEAIMNNKLLVENDEKIMPLTLKINNGHYYLIYSYYPKLEKIYIKRLDHIENKKLKCINQEKNIENKITNEKIKKALIKNYNMFQKETIRIELEILNKKKEKAIIDSLRNNFNNYILKNNNNHVIDGIENANFYGEIIKFGNNIKIIGPKKFKENFLIYVDEILKINKSA